MTKASLPLDRLPGWPRFLTRDLAAAFVGVSPNLFDAEVQDGRWPAGIPRGASGKKLTWDRKAIEMAADADLGLFEGVDHYEVERRKAAARYARITKGK